MRSVYKRPAGPRTLGTELTAEEERREVIARAARYLLGKLHERKPSHKGLAPGDELNAREQAYIMARTGTRASAGARPIADGGRSRRPGQADDPEPRIPPVRSLPVEEPVPVAPWSQSPPPPVRPWKTPWKPTPLRPPLKRK